MPETVSVIAPARMKDDAKDGDLLVLYMGRPPEATDSEFYVRPVGRFLEHVQHEGKTVPRFAYVRPRFEVNPVDNVSIVDNKDARKVVVTTVDPSLAKTLCETMNSRYQ
jgi:hypothetical protein